MARTPTQVVEDFCKLWSNPTLDSLVDSFTDDAVYHNIPVKPMNGKDQIRKGLEGMNAGMGNVVFEILAIAANGNTVLTERVDHMDMNGKRISIPVMGVFEVEGEKLKAWRDYFDMAQFQKMVQG
jgi:limonene-1,2-epoxide hydrolase